MKIAFIHPDLGIGGAERLIVDAAYGLQEEDHKVTIFTSHCDKSHSFEEVKNNRLAVKVYGDFLPTHFLNNFKIIFAILRQLVLIFQMIISGEIYEYDYFIVDLLSFCLPILHLFHNKKAKILFYCHFPDQRLARHDSLIRTLYRLPFDLYEQFSTATADSIAVNSKFTKSIYNETLTLIKDKNVPIFERKKNFELALNAFKIFKKTNIDSKAKLIIAGGYDSLLEENKSYLQDLEKLAIDSNLKILTVFNNEYKNYSESGKIDYEVLFLPSVSSNLKEKLLSESVLLLYTPSFEHFGIVPLEAMKFGIPTLAVNNGGPTETVISLDEDPENGTGWLEPSNEKKWSLKLSESLKLSKELIIRNGARQLDLNFTRERMTERFEENIFETLKTPYKSYTWEKILSLWKIPIVLFLQHNFETFFAYTITLFLLFPFSTFQLFGIVCVSLLYTIDLSWFAKWW